MNDPAFAHLPAAVIDQASLAELVEAVGADELQILAAALKEDAAGQLAALQGWLGNGDIAGAKRTAHRLAGLFAQFGAAVVERRAHAMRHARDIVDARRIGEALLGDCREALAALDGAVAEVSTDMPRAA